MPAALIWGASGGMGSALVTLLKQEGWLVYAAARSTEQVPAEADGIYEYDAALEQSYEAVARLVAQEAGTIDLMVYAVGQLAFEKLDKLSLADWRMTLDSNLTGAYLAAHHGLPLMEKGAHLVFIGAYSDHIRYPKFGPYAVAKAGLAELVHILRKEQRRMHITLVRPGAVNTGFWNYVSLKMPEDAKDPSVVAEAILAQYNAGAGIDLDL